MRPAFLNDMSWRMAEVYGAVTDRLLINMARYFPYIKDDQVSGSFEYQARLLAKMGQVNRESAQIIRASLQGADDALKKTLEAAIVDALKTEEPKLRKAAEKGLLNGDGGQPPEVDAGTMQAFQSYYRQSADKLNLVNTVMLESTEEAYRSTVSDISARISRTQGTLNAETGEVVIGATSINQAIRDGVKKMVENGLTGFIDHGGHHWSPEAYVAMDIKTTMFSTARAAVWERNEQYGNDLYQVSTHAGARPLCYPWQGKVISASDWSGEVEDLDGNKVHVYAQSETTYGEPAGLFGINCGHYPMPFIPGFSTIKGEPQDPEENAKAYAESQQQRALERKLREEKRDLEVMKAQGAPEAEIKAQKERVAQASHDIQAFCDETGRTRLRERETAPVRAEWPGENSGKVTRFNGEYISTDVVPPAKGPFEVEPQANVAQQATQEPQTMVQSEATSELVTKILPNTGIKTVEPKKWEHTPTQEEIVSEIGGADKTSGSCASVSLAYAGNKAGYQVHDFRGGASMDWFSTKTNTQKIAELPEIGGMIINGKKEIEIANKLLSQMTEGKEYWLGIGRHASIVRKSASGGNEYLELQSATNNGWHPLDDSVLRWRFGCRQRRSYDLPARMMEVEKLTKSADFIETLKYINTDVNAQRKGAGGGIK